MLVPCLFLGAGPRSPPTGFMLESVGRHLGDFLVEFVGYDVGNNSVLCRAYMRLRWRLFFDLMLKLNSF